jgi:hypothetical protein
MLLSSSARRGRSAVQPQLKIACFLRYYLSLKKLIVDLLFERFDRPTALAFTFCVPKQFLSVFNYIEQCR